jgi:hypothetical protein
MLTLLGIVVNGYEIEAQLNLTSWFKILIAGFIVHALLPGRFRLRFFILLFPIGSIYLFGPIEGSAIIAMCLTIFGITELPIKTLFKGLILLILALVLAFSRAGIILTWVPTNALIIVASVFMFRAIIFLYELKYNKNMPAIGTRLGYFLLLPNLVFPLFPVIDLKTFSRTYYDRPDFDIYARGIRLMARGVFHLLLYRLIYLYAIPDLESITTALQSFQYISVSYLLILRLSGIFHFVVGTLCLFGFNLPEIFDNYFLANGFDDYWRRINIYWKDFMLKVFYYPIYFKIKKMGTAKAVAVTTFLVFGITWFLHAYQWFWILGSYTFRATDNFFWLTFGILVTWAAYRKSLNPGQQRIASFMDALREGVKIVFTFMTAAVLWSIWISPRFSDWFAIVNPLVESMSGFVVVVLVILSIVMVLSFGLYSFNTSEVVKNHFSINDSKSKLFYTLLIPFLALMNMDVVSTSIKSNTGLDVSDFTSSTLNQSDQRNQFQGYYEEVLEGNSFIKQNWVDDEMNDDSWIRLDNSHAIRKTGDFLVKELNPLIEVEFKGSKLTTNKWGIRDKAYSLQRDSSVLRMVLIGGSTEMGSGVGDDEVFEAVVENYWNDNHPEQRFESMNFSIGARSLIQNVYLLENKVLAFNPTHIMIAHHEWDWEVTLNLFNKVLSERRIEENRFPYEYLNDLMDTIGIKAGDSKRQIRQKLSPYKEDIFRWVYKTISEIANREGIELIWVHIPEVSVVREGDKFDVAKAMTIADELGYYTINLEDVFENYETDHLRVAIDDQHPNSLGHKILAEKLYPELEKILQK